MQPSSAILAVTLNCNARCTMCDIWQNDMHQEMLPEEYAVLPASLRDINISGGEPFLRPDLPAIIGVLRQTCPEARFVISTNGFLPERIGRMVDEILAHAPQLAVRVSIDGMHQTHDDVRGIPGGFDKCLDTLGRMKQLGIADLGIGFTILERNMSDLPAVHEFARDRDLQLSVTIATDSSIFFGEGKTSMRPQSTADLQAHLAGLSATEYRRWTPKNWFRGWYASSLADYAGDGVRPLACDAGSGFFYLDSLANVFGCHLLPGRMGSLRQNTWDEIWDGSAAQDVRQQASGCQECWMVCTSKSALRRRLPALAMEAAAGKLAAHLRTTTWD